MIRFATRTGERITTDRGEHTRDSDRLPFRWADYSATFQGASAISGVALFPHPDHPDYAPYWQIRPYGILSMSWPGSRPYVIEPGQSVTLAYRMMIHRGDAMQSNVAAAWDAYMMETNGPDSSAVERRIELFNDPDVSWTQVGTATFELQEGRLRARQ